MTTILIIVCAILVLVLLFAFAKLVAREANRIEIETDYRVKGLQASVDVVNHLLCDDDRAAEKAERKANRYHARAEEVASRQSPGWKAYSKAVQKRR